MHVGVLSTWRQAAKGARKVQEIVALPVAEEKERAEGSGAGRGQKGGVGSAKMWLLLVSLPCGGAAGGRPRKGEAALNFIRLLPHLKCPLQFLKLTMGSGYSLKSFCE